VKTKFDREEGAQDKHCCEKKKHTQGKEEERPLRSTYEQAYLPFQEGRQLFLLIFGVLRCFFHLTL
jgi:hypothetical protein